jgi:hypothetical protein
LQQEHSISVEEGKADAAQEEATFWRARQGQARVRVSFGGGRWEARRIRRAAAMGGDMFYNASTCAGSTSGNGTEASPPEATRNPSVGAGGGLLQNRRLQTGTYRWVVRALIVRS